MIIICVYTHHAIYTHSIILNTYPNSQAAGAHSTRRHVAARRSSDAPLGAGKRTSLTTNVSKNDLTNKQCGI